MGYCKPSAVVIVVIVDRSVDTGVFFPLDDFIRVRLLLLTCCFAGIGGFREVELSCGQTIILGGIGGGISGVVGIDTGGGGGGRFLKRIGRSGASRREAQELCGRFFSGRGILRIGMLLLL